TESGTRTPRLRPAGHVAPKQLHAAAARGKLAREHVDERRLAGPVRTDHRMHFVAHERERHVVDGDEAAEMPRHALGAKQDVSRHARPGRAGAATGPA